MDRVAPKDSKEAQKVNLKSFPFAFGKFQRWPSDQQKEAIAASKKADAWIFDDHRIFLPAANKKEILKAWQSLDLSEESCKEEEGFVSCDKADVLTHLDITRLVLASKSEFEKKMTAASHKAKKIAKLFAIVQRPRTQTEWE